MKVYKGTDKNMRCLGYQYEVGKTEVHEGRIELCKSGFHACENPLDVLAYHPAYEGARYFEAKAEGDMQKATGESKLACTKLTLTGEIGLMGLIKAGVTAIFEKAKKIPATSGDWSTAATSGDRSTAATSGEQSIAVANGYEAGACGKAGSYIVATEYNEDYKLIDCKCAKVDGETIKENVVYILKNGVFVEKA